MSKIPHGEPYAGKLHVRFDEGAGVPCGGVSPYSTPRLTVGTDPGGLFTNLHELTRILFIFVKFVLIRGQQIMGGLSWRGRRGSPGDRPWREILKFVEKKIVGVRVELGNGL